MRSAESAVGGLGRDAGLQRVEEGIGDALEIMLLLPRLSVPPSHIRSRPPVADLPSLPLQQPTESYDNMNPDPSKEPRFDIMGKLHEYLEDNFPLVFVSLFPSRAPRELTPLTDVNRHEKLQLEKVATYGLLYTWHGSSPSLAPIVRRSPSLCCSALADPLPNTE
jgi:hypothetical protein